MVMISILCWLARSSISCFLRCIPFIFICMILRVVLLGVCGWMSHVHTGPGFVSMSPDWISRS